MSIAHVVILCGVLALASVAAAVRANRPAARENRVAGPAFSTLSREEPSAVWDLPQADHPRAASRAHKISAAHSPLKGKGMWIYKFDLVASGNAAAIARLATTAGLTHIFVRVGSGAAGLATLQQAASLIPSAHSRGIKVIAWYFPYFKPVAADVAASVATIRYRIRGQGFDGFAADIEPTPGSLLTAASAAAYSKALRRAAGSTYLVAVPPRPSPLMIRKFPYAATLPYYDAIAPMVYWGRLSPGELVGDSIRYLTRFGLPIAPIGQAYDMGPEGGPAGNPSRAQIVQFMAEAKRLRSLGVSFWEWREASLNNWRAIREFDW